MALPIEEILASEDRPSLTDTHRIGNSREGRDLLAHRLGEGPLQVSLIGGCHADEPVGPSMLARLAGWLQAQVADHPLLTSVTWSIVPHVNPDGAARNAAWTEVTEPLRDHLGEPDLGYELNRYLAAVVRELPGDDIEFGFPHDPEDREAILGGNAARLFGL